eukprot:3613005-Rhodomonas_salina.2
MLRLRLFLALTAALAQQASCFHLAASTLPLRSAGRHGISAAGRFGAALPLAKGTRRGGARSMVAQQKLTPELEEEAAMIKKKLEKLFKEYDKNRDGYLTLEEYNQWCVDTKRGIRQLTTDIRYRAFCKVSHLEHILSVR